MAKSSLYMLIFSLLSCSMAQAMHKQLTKLYLSKNYLQHLRCFSTLSAEEVALSKKKLQDLEKLQRAEHFAYSLCCAGIRLDNHAAYTHLTTNYEKNSKKLAEEFERELAKLKSHYNSLQSDNQS